MSLSNPSVGTQLAGFVGSPSLWHPGSAQSVNPSPSLSFPSLHCPVADACKNVTGPPPGHVTVNAFSTCACSSNDTSPVGPVVLKEKNAVASRITTTSAIFDFGDIPTRVTKNNPPIAKNNKIDKVSGLLSTSVYAITAPVGPVLVVTIGSMK